MFLKLTSLIVIDLPVYINFKYITRIHKTSLIGGDGIHKGSQIHFTNGDYNYIKESPNKIYKKLEEQNNHDFEIILKLISLDNPNEPFPYLINFNNVKCFYPDYKNDYKTAIQDINGDKCYVSESIEKIYDMLINRKGKNLNQRTEIIINLGEEKK